jgi:hypothetical protein
LQQVLEKEVLDEDLLLIRHDREFLKISFYASLQPGTNKISVIIAVIRESHDTGLHSLKNEKFPGNTNKSMFHDYLDNSLAPAWISDEDGRALFMNRLALHIWHLDEHYRSNTRMSYFPNI